MTDGTAKIVWIDRDRLWSTLMDLKEIGAYDDEATGLRGVRRLALTDADDEARRRCVQWMTEAGLEVRVDKIGNVYATRPGKDRSLPCVLIGSHIETVATGGAFDGTLGMLGEIDDGLCERFPADRLFGIHNLPGTPAGHLRTRPGPVMAAEDNFTIHISGRGGHASAPHLVIDPLVIGAEIVLALQHVVARSVDPVCSVVLSCTDLQTDGARNAIPSNVTITGDTRSFDHENHVDFAAEPIMASEDFGVLAHYVPACLAFLGNGTEQSAGASHSTATTTRSTTTSWPPGSPTTATSSRRALQRTDAHQSFAARHEPVSNLGLVSGKSERRAARSVVADYHDAQLGELVARVGDAIDRHRAGELDAFDVDRVLFQYSRAAKELWKFCNYLQVEVAAAMIREQPPNDWWERGAPRER